MKSENITDYEVNNKSTDEAVKPASTVQEVDTASINAAEQDATPQSKLTLRSRTRHPSRNVGSGLNKKDARLPDKFPG